MERVLIANRSVSFPVPFARLDTKCRKTYSSLPRLLFCERTCIAMSKDFRRRVLSLLLCARVGAPRLSREAGRPDLRDARCLVLIRGDAKPAPSVAEGGRPYTDRYISARGLGGYCRKTSVDVSSHLSKECLYVVCHACAT